MTKKQALGDLRMIPIDRIEVLNPRDRNKQVFEQIVENIKSVGLKKPITVTPRPGDDGGEKYLLVCGEGRLKAFMALGETTIAALVVDVSEEEAFIMSMVENIARRKSSPLELLAGIQQLVAKGYDKKTIAKKTGLSVEYVQGIMLLLKNGEERLMVAVESGRICKRRLMCSIFKPPWGGFAMGSNQPNSCSSKPPTLRTLFAPMQRPKKLWSFCG